VSETGTRTVRQVNSASHFIAFVLRAPQMNDIVPSSSHDDRLSWYSASLSFSHPDRTAAARQPFIYLSKYWRGNLATSCVCVVLD